VRPSSTRSRRCATSRDLRAPRPAAAWAVIGALVAVKLALHWGTTLWGPYEFHRDEFLYLAMGEHLRLFGMDFPPLIAILAETVRGVLGDSLFAIRLLPSLASAGVMVLAALIARELGGGRFAQGLSALAVLASPLFLRTGSLFQPVVFDQLWFALAMWCLARRCSSDDPRWWLGFGFAAGFGLLTKFSMVIFGAAVFVAVVATPERRSLRTRWPWLAAAIALVLGSPGIIGQIALGFPVLGQMGDLRSAQLGRMTASGFLLEQLRQGPTTIVAVVGLGALLYWRGFERYRLLGTAAGTVLVLLLLLHGKGYYLGPDYPVLYGAGAVALEAVGGRVWRPVVRWGTVTALVAYAGMLLPLGLPILKPPVMERYLEALGIEDAADTNIGVRERIPQDYGDMLTWRTMVDSVASAYRTLTAEEQRNATILARNYGEAGAIDFYGPAHGLPKAVAIVGSYWFWGPGDRPGDPLLAVGFPAEDLADRCGATSLVNEATNAFAVAEERVVPVRVCRSPVRLLRELWPEFKGMN